MENVLVEVKESWNHCKELLSTDAHLDLVVAFLEDFKVQFTEFSKRMKAIGKRTYYHATFSLVDKAFMFWKQEGELSRLINYVKNNWHKKAQLLKKIETIDKAISRIIEYYTVQLKTITN